MVTTLLRERMRSILRTRNYSARTDDGVDPVSWTPLNILRCPRNRVNSIVLGIVCAVLFAVLNLINK